MYACDYVQSYDMHMCVYMNMQCGVGKCVFMVSVVYGCPVANHTENMCLVIWLLVEERG